ncbi:unnamed protein product [Parajaminaea phylloscopi]
MDAQSLKEPVGSDGLATAKLRRPSSHAPPAMRLPEGRKGFTRLSSMTKSATSLSHPFHKTFVPTSLPPDARTFLVGTLVSISGLLYGLDTGSIGPITEMPQFQEVSGNIASKPTLQGFFVASVLLSASVSSLCSGYVADRISRRWGIGLGACIFAVGAIVSVASSNIATLFVARSLIGIGAGQQISVASIWLIEVAKPKQRGTFACVIQFLITIGICTGYFICYATQGIKSSMAWRLPFIIQGALAVVLALCILLVVPYSPRWLVSQGRDEEARQILRQLRLTNSSAKRTAKTAAEEDARREEETLLLENELQEIRTAVHASKLAARGRGASYGELFHKKYRFRVLLGIFFMACQQLSGIDVVLYFSPIIFKSIWTSQTATFLASGVSGIVLVVATVPALIWVDRWGRKPPMILGGLGMASAFLIIGSLFAAFGRSSPATEFDDGRPHIVLTNSVAKWAVVVLIYAFVAMYSLTWAVVTRIYAGEIVPTRLRSRAVASQQLANWATNFTVALIAPLFLRASPSGPYFLFAGAILLSTAVTALCAKETKGKSLEEISDMFDTKT